MDHGNYQKIGGIVKRGVDARVGRSKKEGGESEALDKGKF